MNLCLMSHLQVEQLGHDFKEVVRTQVPEFHYFPAANDPNSVDDFLARHSVESPGEEEEEEEEETGYMEDEVLNEEHADNDEDLQSETTQQTPGSRASISKVVRDVRRRLGKLGFSAS